MERKKIAPNSFQQEIVDFLKDNFPGSFTGKEILKKINGVNKSLGKEERSIGSLSGTLKVLCQGGWVLRSDEYPSRYSYQHEQDTQHVSLELSESTQSNESIRLNAYEECDPQASQDPILQSIHEKASDIRSRIVLLNKQIEQLSSKRSMLEVQLEPLEELLAQYKK